MAPAMSFLNSNFYRVLLGAVMTTAITLPLPSQEAALDWRIEYENGLPASIVWETIEGMGYELWVSGELLYWNRAEGYPKAGTGAPMRHSIPRASEYYYKWIITEAGVPPSGFVLIPQSAYRMGNENGGDLDEYPVHETMLSAFYIQANETTKAEWDVVYKWAITHGYVFDRPGYGKGATHPVVDINWYDAAKWCNARSEMDGLVPCYYRDTDQILVYRNGRVNLTNAMVKWRSRGYRLPTEAEWEKAARGGLGSRRFPWGDTISHAQANYYSSPDYSYDVSQTLGYHPAYGSGAAPYTAPVGRFPQNNYGLFDVAGNVWEWCWDWYALYDRSFVVDPLGPGSGSLRIRRGGSWTRDTFNCRVSERSALDPDSPSNRDGFRTVRTP